VQRHSVALECSGMSFPSSVFPPPVWSNQDIVLYHGTLAAYAPAILTKVRVALGRREKDFGPGFYMTTILHQAHAWALRRVAQQLRGDAFPAVIQIIVSREALARLQTLAFIRGDSDADDYWSFVHYCRYGALDHRRPSPQTYYDVVYGPVSKFWRQSMIFADKDHISFHTPAAEEMLNLSRKLLIE